MSSRISRREMLAGGLGAATLLGGRWLPGAWAQQTPAVPPLPKRSQQAPSLPVAIQKCASYEPALLRSKLDAALELIGGIKDLVRNKTVTIKVNMTGPVRDFGGLPASRTYHIHPSVVAAVCAALRDAGARRIAVVEALYYTEAIEKILELAGWDLPAIRSAGGEVIFENTKNRGSGKEYGRVQVPWGGYLFPAFALNAWYVKTDVLVSLSKLKQHGTAGVTMACKNLFGILPTALYGNDAPNEDTVQARVALLHEAKRKVPAGVPGEIDRGDAPDAGHRVPRVVADIVAARPVDLCIVDGIDTIRGGEGFWNPGVAPIQPKLLLAGRNPVCTDAVCTAAMGFSPTVPHGQFPFQGENHLQLLADAGVGTHEPARIEVRGVTLKEAVVPFAPGQSSHRPRSSLAAHTAVARYVPYCWSHNG